MRRMRFNAYVPSDAQPQSERRRAIREWLHEQLAQGPAWPSKITRQGKARGYALAEICGALGALHGLRDHAGRWMLPRATSSTMETTT